MYNAVYNSKDKFKGYLNIYFTQSPNIVTTHSTPNNFTEILAVLGGFVTLVTKFIGWGIKSYQIFQYRKSSVKKLYYYTRTKKKEQYTRSLFEKAKVNDTASVSPESKEKSLETSLKKDFSLLNAVIMSKAILSFGYSQSF